jgi:RNA polymerase sigma-70 factor (ECF subfamily)
LSRIFHLFFAFENLLQIVAENLKPLLTTYAYNILGSLEDAQDVVQDAFLKYHLVNKQDINDEKAYLTRMVINLAINLKKKLQKVVADYPGAWLPEPVATDGADSQIEKEEVLSYSLMVLLEKLNPRQRGVFILKEAFDYEHEEIADVLGISVDNSRQLLNRARKQLQKENVQGDPAVRAGNVDRYLHAIQSGDATRVEELLNEDIVAVSDGGGKVSAAINPILGRHDVAAFITGIVGKFYSAARIETGEINHQPALFFYVDDYLSTCQILLFENDRLKNIFFIRNPEKLRLLSFDHQVDEN